MEVPRDLLIDTIIEIFDELGLIKNIGKRLNFFDIEKSYGCTRSLDLEQPFDCVQYYYIRGVSV